MAQRTSESHGRRARGALKNAATLLGALLASLVLLELVIRVWSALLFPKMMVLDDTLGWKHAANLRKTFINEFGDKSLVVQNDHGHRGNYYNFAKDDTRYRVLVLGDSFTEGIQVAEQDLFTSRIEQIKPHIQMINAGVGGYGTVQEYLYLRTQGLKFNPDAVLLMFFENDLNDNSLSYYPAFGPRPYASLVHDGVRIRENLDSTEYLRFVLPVPFRMTLNSFSYLYYLLNSRIYQRMRADRMKQFLQDDIRKVDNETKLNIFYGIISDMRDLLRLRRIDLIIALIPSREEVRLGESRTHNLIARFCEGNDVKCALLLERFRRESLAGKQPYFPVDIHWTRDGHEIAADELAGYLP